MSVYEYVAKDHEGKTFRGKLEAPDKQAAMGKLHGDNLIIISVSETAAPSGKIRFGGGRMKLDDLVVFSRQLATMVDAGIPILGSLDILTQQAEGRLLKEVLARVRNDVEIGFSLSNAFIKHPRVFSAFYISMVKAGESSGMLDEILDRLAAYLEKTSALQKKLSRRSYIRRLSLQWRLR
jgi:type IV pilus assembly protein PilC